MLDARPRSFYSVTGAGNNRFTSAREACDDRANGIVASVTGALGFRDCQLHEPLFRFVGRRDHVDPKLARTLVTNCYASPPKLLYRPKISPRAATVSWLMRAAVACTPTITQLWLSIR